MMKLMYNIKTETLTLHIASTQTSVGFKAVANGLQAMTKSLHGDTSTERRTEVSKKVSDILPKTEILGQLAEELAEASAAASKLRRKIDGKNPTPKTLEECWEDLKKDIGDVMNAIDALTEQDSQNYHEFMSECGEYAEPKMERWLSRLEAKEQSDE